MAVIENSEWSDDDKLDNFLMESRYDITNAKTFYLVSILYIINRVGDRVVDVLGE
jgi:hypothetical protein